jgi:hypothetical protein
MALVTVETCGEGSKPVKSRLTRRILIPHMNVMETDARRVDAECAVRSTGVVEAAGGCSGTVAFVAKSDF